MLKPAPQRVGLLFLILAFALASPAFGQTIQMFTDQPTFAAGAPNLTTIDFASQLSPGHVLGQITGPGGLTVDGVQFHGLPTNFLYVVAPGYSFPYQGWNANPTVLQSLAPVGTTLVVTLPSGTTAVGTYIYTIQGVINPPPVYAFGAPVPVDVALANGQTQTFDVQTSGPPTVAFVGFTSTSPIASLTFHAPTVAVAGAGPGGYVNLANFSFQAGCQVNPNDVNLFAGGPYSLDGKPTSMIATFTPTDANGLPVGLDAAKAACGVTRFNFQQKVDAWPSPSSLFPADPIAATWPPSTPFTAPLPQGSFPDPPNGGYTYDVAGTANRYPYYWPDDPADQILMGTPILVCQLGNCAIYTIETNSSLLFVDGPADPCLPGGSRNGCSGFAPQLSDLRFTTKLVGISGQGASRTSRDLFTWQWISNFNGTVRGIVAVSNYLPSDPNSGTGGITITSLNGVSQAPPQVSCSATPIALWPPNGKSIPVTISGRILAGTSALVMASPSFTVIDSEQIRQPTGTFTPEGDGTYSLTVPLEASRSGTKKDGRHYTIIVSVRDKIGNLGTCSTVVTVPHDQGN